MKTIIENESKLSKYIFEDDEEIILEENLIKTSEMFICDLNSNNSTVVSSVTPPEDWAGNKYMYENDTWTLNSDWIDPETDKYTE